MIEIRENDKSWDLGTLFSDRATAPSCPDCYIPLDKHLHRLDLHQSKAGSKQHVLNMPTFNALHQEMRACNFSEPKTAPGELNRTHRTGEQSWISSSMASKRDSSNSSMPVLQICEKTDARHPGQASDLSAWHISWGQAPRLSRLPTRSLHWPKKTLQKPAESIRELHSEINRSICSFSWVFRIWEYLGPLLGWWHIQFHERRCSMPHNLKFFN